MSEEIKPLTTDDDVSKVSMNVLRRTLLTCDGSGRKIKELALNELIQRLQEDNV